jgi:Effector-associated domain 10/NACHT domain
MANPSNLNNILQRILDGTQTDVDIEDLRKWLNSGGVQDLQVGKYNVNIGQGQDIHIGDCIYQGLNAEAIREVVMAVTQGSKAADIRSIVRSILNEELTKLTRSGQPQVNELVQQVRTGLHDCIKSLHGTMQLWGIDHWVPLGDLFVDVNILEEVSSSRRLELDDLWQDFTTNNSDYCSLDRIGLGQKRERVSGLKVLEKNTNIMVVGKPGSGKTTYLQSIVTECNDGKFQAQRIPVLIKLREFVDDGRKFEYNLEKFLEQLWQLSNSDLKLVLDRGLALVLLDGLDEVVGEVGKQINKEIKWFARVYPQNQIVVTCRTQSQESRFDRFDYVEVADFNEEQVRVFATHWFKAVSTKIGEGATKAVEFLEQLFQEKNKAIRELAITPILLSLTCTVFYKTEKFYSKRSKLYEEGLELLLGQWDKSREVERDEIYRDLSVEQKLELLSYVAVKKFEQEQYVLFEQEELERYIEEFLGIDLRGCRLVLKAISLQHGLLIERAQKIWSFSHLTFQEYLVGKQLVESMKGEYKGKYYFSTNRLQEPFTISQEIQKSGNELFMLLKEKNDSVLIEDEEIKSFMRWVNKKSKSIDSNYTQTAIRTFYFGLDSAIDSYLGCSFNKGIVREINNNIFRGAIEDPSIYIDRVLVGLLELISSSYHSNRNGSISVSNHYAYSINLIEGDISLDSCGYKLKKLLQQLIIEIPHPRHERELFDIWCEMNGGFWSDKLRETMIDSRNIGYDWNFSARQMDVLSNYFKSNVFFVNNFRDNPYIDDIFKNKFMGELFLLSDATVGNS